MASGTCGFRTGDVRSQGARQDRAPRKGGQVFPWGEGLGPSRVLFSFLSVLGEDHCLSLSRLYSGQSPCLGLATALSHC